VRALSGAEPPQALRAAAVRRVLKMAGRREVFMVMEAGSSVMKSIVANILSDYQLICGDIGDDARY
jgi:hypothetical protein